MTRNRKQLLADFYLDLLAQPHEWQAARWQLCDEVVYVLALELDSDVETVKSIFKRMAREDE